MAEFKDPNFVEQLLREAEERRKKSEETAATEIDALDQFINMNDNPTPLQPPIQFGSNNDTPPISMKEVQSPSKEDRMQSIIEEGIKASQEPLVPNQFPFRPLDQMEAPVPATEEQILKAADAENASPERKSNLLSGSDSGKSGNEGGDKSPVDKYKEMLDKYEAAKSKANASEAFRGGLQTIMDSLAQFDLAGGPQFSGLKAKTVKLPEINASKQVENKFNKQIQLEGLKRKEELAKRKKQDKLDSEKIKTDKEKRLASQFAQTNSQKWIDRVRKSDVYKDNEKVLNEADRIRALVDDAVEFGGQSLAMLGPKVAKGIAGEVGVLTETDVTRYVKNPSLVGGLKDTLLKVKSGKLSEVSAENLKRLLQIMESKAQDSMKDLYDKNAKLFSRSSNIPYNEARMYIDPNFSGESAVQETQAKPPGKEIEVRNGKTYKWNPSTGTYQLFKK